MPVPKVKTRFSGRNEANEENPDIQRPGGPSSSSSVPRPTLLGAGSPQLPAVPTDGNDYSLFPPRPRRLWKVSDTRLNALPAGYPPVDPRCSIYVADAPPSVVAVRIAEALRRLSVAVEYDEETPCATCWTADRCHFVVQLWQGPKNAFSVRAPEIPDLSAGILVEGMRLSGSVITFHRMIRSVLAAAISHDTGDDRRKPYQSDPLEFPRWNLTEPQLIPGDDDNRDYLTTTFESLEDAANLLEKDRHDAQTIGMERLVHLTDIHGVGVEVAIIAAQSLLGVPPVEEPSILMLNMHKDWMMGLLVQRRLPNEKGTAVDKAEVAPTQQGAASRASRFACAIPKQGSLTHDTGETTTANDEDNESARVEALLQQMREERALTGDANHAGRLRGLLMRVWANSLQVLHKHDNIALTTLLQHQTDITSREFVDALLEDAEGCSRPPLAAVMGTSLATPHESVWALVCLRILSQHSTVARRHLEKTSYAGVLEKAVLVGSALHGVLQKEAKSALRVWSEKRA
uniref:Uncharacterized protein n=1 Tax=Amphora coffeiformis TaxID=265554 RepID=A0A7S3L4H1_9STRA|mmetsp:Transcript_19762/g.37467  ORF Transcript_19762/g.37467 Transcript_19762/m.37467 type:complete len:517 (-) Transcript_19762:53-1603(-)